VVAEVGQLLVGGCSDPALFGGAAKAVGAGSFGELGELVLYLRLERVQPGDDTVFVGGEDLGVGSVLEYEGEVFGVSLKLGDQLLGTLFACGHVDERH
jgi:hypothetical protein